MKNLTILMLLAALTACGGNAASNPPSTPDTSAGAACAPTSNPGPDEPEPLAPPALASTPEELLRVIDRGGTTLDRLTPEARQEILDSALWTASGIATFRATRARAELSEQEFDLLLGVFGLRRQDAIENAKCIGYATCRQSAGDWCVLRNCIWAPPPR